jgi:tetratricopeptide (TPR) repeat protein
MPLSTKQKTASKLAWCKRRRKRDPIAAHAADARHRKNSYKAIAAASKRWRETHPDAPTKLMLNMIVRNETDRIIRCLESVVPFISCFTIIDTGSTDDTIQKIERFFAAASIPGEITHAPFVNFEQARNAALDLARKSPLSWDYLLLCDADMELVVEDKDFKNQLGLGGMAYNAVQKAGTLSYHNTRFVNRAATGNYVGVTHEYLDVPSAGEIKGVWFSDHADGENRKDKSKRDIRLLKAALKTDPNNGRSWFYLAQSYKDAGKPHDAVRAYRKRIALGGWDEEIWNSYLNLAHSLKDCGDEAGFIQGLIAAYNYRPSRAESLYDLANYYRNKGMNHAALMAAEEGLRIKRPGDLLFVNDYVYSTGLREEFTIVAYYDKDRRDRGFDMCNYVALSKEASEFSREQARGNLFHYIRPLCERMSSFSTRRIAFTPPDGYTAMNPSVAMSAGQIYVLLRSVNYTMDEQGRYLIKSTNGEANSTNPIHTRNFLLQLRDNFEVKTSDEVISRLPKPAFDLVVGFEDMRLFFWKGTLCINACVREQNSAGWCEQWFAKLAAPAESIELVDARAMLPAHRQHEKNWMPWVDGDKLEFAYRLGLTVDEQGRDATRTPINFAVDQISGGSQVIPFKCGFLSVVHEARVHPHTGKRYYQHRFVWYDKSKTVQRITKPFYFHDKVIEFVAGVAWHPNGQSIMISYGREDKEAWIATVDANELSEFIWHD